MYNKITHLIDVVDKDGNGNFPSLTVAGQLLVEELLLSDTVWEDMRFPATRTRRGSNDKPDFDFTNIGLLFPQNDAAEKIYISDQMSHMWKQGTLVKPHIHYIQTGAAVPTFKLAQRFYDNGGPVPDFTTITTTTAVFTYTTGTIMQILLFPDIELTDLGTSAWFDMILYREDNTVTGDVLYKGFDFHYQLDSLGSREEYVK